MRIQQLTEQPRRVAAVAFGRMNPPTIGHAKLVDAVKSQAGDPYIFLSQSQKPKTDPLSFEQKIGFAKAFFPGVTVGDPEVRTIFDALNKIYAMGYTDLVYVAGSDRVQQFTDLINKYNGQEDFYSFDSIQVVSAGERDPDAEGAEGMSASKMRAAAVAGDFEAFKSGTPNPDMAQNMYDAVRTGMGMMESLARIIEVASRLRQLHEVKPLTENVKRAFGIVVEAWSEKYKRSINCDNPKGFSQRAHCQGRKKNEDIAEGLRTDVPNERWLQDKIEYAKEQGRDSFGAPYFGKVTAWTDSVTIPVSILKSLPGARGEQKNVRKDDLEAIMKIMKDTSKLPLSNNGKEYKPFITVAYNGEAWVSEGNHRIMAAAALGWKELPIELKYFDGGERIKDGPLYPSKIGLSENVNESYKLQLERDNDLLVLHIKNTQTGQRTEVRGKPNYEGDGYDSDDKLHQLLDKIGKAANMSELMNGEVVSINPRHPDGPRARKRADKAFNEDVAKDLEAEFPGLYLDLYKTKAGYILGKIELPKEERGEGIGTRVMQRIVDIADSEGEVVALTPDTAFGASSKGRLEKFYKRFGFVFNKGRNKDYSFRETMIRYPQGPEARATVKDIAGESINEAGVGRITKQNATKDAPIGSEYANVKKLGLGSGKPEELHAKARKNSDPNTLFNLGLTEGQLNEKGSIGIPLSSGMTVVIAPHRPLKVKKSKKKVKLVGAGGEE